MPKKSNRQSAGIASKDQTFAPHHINISARLPVTAATGISTREYVYQCIQAAAPGAEFGDESTLDSIPVNGDDVGTCLNYRIPLTGNDAWRAGDIKGEWTVAVLIAKTDFRRKH